MTGFDLRAYQPADTLYLWWLADPGTPRLIGELRMVRSLRGVSLLYSPSWLEHGFALSEDLPLQPGEFLPPSKETAAGAVDDARPDRWGERVIRALDKPPRLAVLDYLFYAGDERFGALGVSISAERYLARSTGPLPRLADASEMERLAHRILEGEPIDERKRRLISPGTTLGGARPKALVDIDGQPWVLKFNEYEERLDTPLIEHATMTLASRAGIAVADTFAVPLPRGHAIAIKRFDRDRGTRRHALSANVALRAAGEGLGYPQLAQLLRRRGTTWQGRNQAQMHELFRRMVFNILMDNTDDHEKNHVLLMDPAGNYELSPAFDVVPSGQALGYQQMRVGAADLDSTLDNALSECAQFGLRTPQAHAQIRQVCNIVAGWKERFASTGVNRSDIEALAGQIDRPFLLDQRAAYR